MKRENFNQNWRFTDLTLAKEPQLITLPHDAMIHQARDAANPSGSAQAFFPGGSYRYEKTFDAPVKWESQHILFQFEGVYKNAKVYINGKEAGGAAYGYIPFFVCADGLLNYGGENTITVTCDNLDQPESRWYSGAGIYRPVWLWTGSTAHIEPEGVRVSTASIDPVMVRVQTQATGGEVHFEILDGDKVLAAADGANVTLQVPGAKLWSENDPKLYTCRVTLTENGKVVDAAEETFGIRQVTWDNKGFYINGVSTLLRGGCVHHDHGILGAATYDESEYRRVKMLKDAGFNAIRAAHNPCSRAMLDACDKLGMYVMDESWDMWFHHKNKFDYAALWRENYRSDLLAMVSRDFNHPSVVMYSIGNEVSEPAKDEGVQKAREMVELLHDADPTRPVTGGFNLMIISSAKKGKGVYDEEGGGRDESGDKAMQGMNSTLFNLVTNMVGTGMNKSANGRKADEATTPLLDSLDIAGYNYASGRYPLEGKAHPNRLIMGSETFPQDIARNWAMVKQYPYLVGDFMWTAWDYLGEVGLGAWGYTKDSKGFNKPYPWLLADTGAMDILGDPNGELFLAQAAWGKLIGPKIAVQPMNHDTKPAKMVWRGTNAVPSWSWQGCDGRKAIVEVYSDAPMVELFLNGKSLGKKKPKECRAIYKTKYQKGDLKAVAYNQAGARLGMDALYTAKGEIGISVKPEAETAKPGQIVYVDVSLTGENGVAECNADRKLTVNVSGGELLAFGSANPRTEERFDAGSYITYYGRALAVVRVEAGDVTITVTDGKQSAAATIAVRK